MNAFVDECRREWKRLGVPDQIAHEMAEDLAADLEEAESDGASAVDVLGSGALDPRSFAATWATERGVVPARPSEGRSRRRASVALAAFVTLAVIAMIGASIAILTTNSDARLAGPDGTPIRIVAPPPPANVSRSTFPVPTRLVIAPDQIRIMGQDASESIDPVGWALLVVGLIGIVPASLLWASWARPRPPTTA